MVGWVGVTVGMMAGALLESVDAGDKVGDDCV